MAKYFSGEPVKTAYQVMDANWQLFCYKCNQQIENGQQVVAREVHKCGEYDYTEIVHAACYNGPPAVVPVPAPVVTNVLIDGLTVEQWLAERGER